MNKRRRKKAEKQKLQRRVHKALIAQQYFWGKYNFENGPQNLPPDFDYGALEVRVMASQSKTEQK